MTTTAAATIDEIAARLEPTPGRLVVQPVTEEETMRGGLHIPATAQEKPVQGIIKALGPPKLLVGVAGSSPPRQLAVGQKILFGKFAGTEIVVDGEDFLILAEEDVLAIVKPAFSDPRAQASRPDPA